MNVADSRRWMHSSTFTIHELKRLKPDKLQICFDFIMFADQINLIGLFDAVIHEVRSLLSRRTALLPKHIHTIFQLPEGHALREVIAQACVKSYAWSLDYGVQMEEIRSPGVFSWRSRRTRFRVEKQMNTIEGFASDLLRAFHRAVRGR